MLLTKATGWNMCLNMNMNLQPVIMIKKHDSISRHQDYNCVFLLNGTITSYLEGLIQLYLEHHVIYV